MTTQDWIREAHRLLDELDEIDLGYPLGANVVLPPQPTSAVEDVLRQIGLGHHLSLLDFYRHCDGVSWPDIHVGYFLKPIARLLDFKPDSEPQSLTGPLAGKVITIGSTGGGGLFVLARSSASILYLPPGPLHSGIYEDGCGQVRQLSHDFGGFLELLVCDLKAFVQNTAGYRFHV